MKSASDIFELFARNPFVFVYLFTIFLAYTKLMEKSVKAAKLVIAGCVVHIVVSYGSQYLVTFLFESGVTDQFGQSKVMLIYSLCSAALHALGFFLILAGVFADRDVQSNDPYANQSVFS